MRPGHAIGLDLGGTELKSALVCSDGALIAFGRRPSGTQESAEAPLAAMAEAVAELRREAESGVVGIGLGCPGVIAPRAGRLVDRTAHLPHWRDLDVAGAIAARTGLATIVDNDANLAALAEYRCGASRGSRVSLTITLGTGIGCGVMIEGRPFRGAWGGAGELGHVPLGRSGRPCACGVADCVEPEASGSALAEETRRLGLPGPSALFDRAADGDAAAGDAVNRFADRLGATVATAVNLFNPDVVVLGGGVTRAGDALLAPLRGALERYALASHRRGLVLRFAALGESAGVVGAGLFAWDELARPAES